MIPINPNKALAELCRRNMFEFVQVFWDIVVTEPPIYNWHIPYLCEELERLNALVERRQPKEYDLLIDISPGSTKSTLVSVMYPVWVWTRDPKQRLITSSYSGTLSTILSLKSRDIIHSDLFRKLFPEIQLKRDHEGHYINTMGGERYATSTGGTVIGMHGHQIIIDDPLNTKEAVSAVARENAEHHVFTTLSTRKVDKEVTPMILIMQRLHEKDPAGLFLERKSGKLRHICLPAEDTGYIHPPKLREYYKDGLFDPLRLNRNVLKEARNELGSYGYSCQFMQSPFPQEGGILKVQWFEIINWMDEFNNLTWDFVIDPAYTSDKNNDESGFITYSVYKNQLLIRHAEGVYKEFPELIKHTQNYVSVHGSKQSRVYVEPKASGKSMVQTLNRETKLNAIEDRSPIKDKEARANDISPVCEAKRVKLIRGNWNSYFLDEVRAFPRGAQDGLIDCLIMACDKLGDDMGEIDVEWY